MSTTTLTLPNGIGGTSRPGRWRNWGRTASGRPVALLRPTTVEQVQAAVRWAAEQGLTVKTVGAGHSFSGIAATDGVLLDIAGLDGLLGVDADTGRATFAAGTNLYQVPALLAPHGLAMANLGDIDRQTLAGATSTGTHGTGLAFGGIATQLRGLTLVTADGSLLRIDETTNAELLSAARVGLGSLGVIVEVTLQCVPAFLLHAIEQPLPLDEVESTLLDRFQNEDHFEFHWFPGTPLASTKTNRRLPADAEVNPRPKFGHWIDEEVLSNGVFQATSTLSRAIPPLITPINQIAAKVFADGEFIEPSHRVFVSRRRVRFAEQEYAVPLEATLTAFQEVRRLIERKGWRIDFPIEVRCAAADENWLSTAHGRPSGYIAVHRYFRQDYREYFREVEAIMHAHDGRPHWGKMHTADAEYLSGTYPKFGDFLAVRDRLDPQRRFQNAELARVLGA